MMIFDGKKESQKILKDLANKIKKQNKKPVLIVVYVGKNSASELYIKNKKIAAKEIGIKVFCYSFDEDVKEKDIIEKINKNNKYPSVDGIIVQLPLPNKFNADKIINSINPEKDVDGFNEISRSLLKKNKQYFDPILPKAIFIALNKSSKGIKSKKIFVFGNSDVFGKTLKDFFKNKGIKIQYFIKNKHSPSQIKLKMKKADIIISVCGEPGFIKGEMIKGKAILIDAGISFVNGRVKGDVDRESVMEKAAFLTPVPGGIGPLTVALLLKNVYRASHFNTINN
jgi:methylenetetrahydrofolate dehydrogenase (NADP+) / methenyltetrahydrofolate cyclohydrolase